MDNVIRPASGNGFAALRPHKDGVRFRERLKDNILHEANKCLYFQKRLQLTVLYSGLELLVKSIVIDLFALCCWRDMTSPDSNPPAESALNVMTWLSTASFHSCRKTPLYTVPSIVSSALCSPLIVHVPVTAPDILPSPPS